MLNPFMLFFFIFVSVNALAADTATLSHKKLLFGGLSVGGGSLAILSLIAALGSLLGSKIKRSSLERFSRFTGLIFGSIGVYLGFDFITKLLQLR